MRLRFHCAAPTVLLVSLTLLAVLAGSQQHHGAKHKSPASGGDEDEEELPLTRSPSAAHDLVFPYETRQQHQKLVDPFAFTFEDYLREASRPAAEEPAREQHGKGLHEVASPLTSAAGGLIVEDDDELAAASNRLLGASEHRQQVNQQVGAQEAAADETDVSLDSNEIKHAARESGAQQKAKQFAESDAKHINLDADSERERQTLAANQHQYQQQPQLQQQQSAGSSNTNELSLAEEIKLLFAWKALPTQRCSRSCGRGFRLNHLSCLDLKYNVRVEDELCLKAQLVKPDETSDEPCNEFDCEPKWTPIEYQQQQCNLISNDTTGGGSNNNNKFHCKPNLFKRIECTMLNKLGQTIHLDESQCNRSARVDEAEQSAADEYSVDLTSGAGDQQQGSSNDISSNEHDESINLPPAKSDDYQTGDNEFQQHERRQMDSAADYLAPGNTRPPPTNEPFFEAGEWSECIEGSAKCGQLGRRYRNLTCRLYLAKSLKFVDLPMGSCAGAEAPHREEPCYIDCNSHAATPPAEQTKKSRQGELDAIDATDDDDDETLLDPSMARYVWQHNRWTECSAKCLGGQMESLVECYDKVTGLPAPHARLCDQLHKPRPIVESCNDVPCAPEWRLEPWSNCSRKCGSAGLRSRSVVCVQLVPLESGETDYMIVASELCHQQRNAVQPPPHKIEVCNRFDCPPEWHQSPWSACSRSCGQGLRNRTVICLQEFAHRDGPRSTPISPDLADAIQLAAAADWHPGKPTQVPYSECYKAHGYVPPISEHCSSGPCDRGDQDDQTSAAFIDSEPMQNYRQLHEGFKRRTVTLKVGGRAQLIEGRNVKIRCRVMNYAGLRRHQQHTNSTSQPAKSGRSQVDWRKDGVQIFNAPNATVAEMKLVEPATSTDSDNSILANDVLNMNDERPMADEPADRKRERTTTSQQLSSERPRKSTSERRRNLSTRSSAGDEVDHQTTRAPPVVQFVAQVGGRFSLVKENSLRIKKLRPEDSGVYSCSFGPLSESIEISVVNKRHFLQQQNGRPSNNYFAAAAA